MACGDPVCTEEDCGPSLGMPNYMCSDGVTLAGPGACEAQEDGTCGWTMVECPEDLCAEVTCPSSPGYCEGDFAYSPTGSTCDPDDGECNVHPSAPPEDCSELGLTCIDGGCVLPPGVCCTSDDDCPDGLACAHKGNGQGTCQAVPDAGMCWTDSHCAEGETCEGAGFGTCLDDGDDDNDESIAPQQGTCEGGSSLPEGCCGDDGDCEDGEFCLDFGSEYKACKPLPADGACWTDDDCGEGGMCEGAAPCPCDAVCVQDSPGSCTPTATACEGTAASDLTGVSIQVTAANCTYTQAEAAGGISVPYEVVVESSILGVSPWSQDAGGCGLPLESGLIIFERLQGGDQLYCMCDTGLCSPLAIYTDLVPGTFAHTFEWNGVNWTGPSDFGNPQGEPFPPGSYTLEISAKGDVDGAEFEVKAAWPIHITE
jgi:hypothetical protein